MRPAYVISPRILQSFFIWPVTWPSFHFFLHFRVTGLKHVADLKPGAVFAVNHTSELDPVLLATALPQWKRQLVPMFYTSRERAFYQHSSWRKLFYGGLLFKMLGAYPVTAGRQDYESALQRHVDILNQGNSLCYFPEGQVTRDGRLHEGHGGVSYLSWRSGKPIVPVCITGAWRMTLGDFFLRRRRVTVSFGKPIYPDELFSRCAGAPGLDAKRNDFSESTKFVMRSIASLHT